MLLALQIISQNHKKIKLQIIIFGNETNPVINDLNFPVFNTGHVSDESLLCDIYNSSDLFVVPSRMDNLPNTVVESLLCGTPVVAFDTCGLKELVVHKFNGYLAKPFSATDLADGIIWTINNIKNHKLSSNSRDYSVKLFSPKVIVPKYINIYQNAICNS